MSANTLPNELVINGAVYIRQHIREDAPEPVEPLRHGVMCNCGQPAIHQTGTSQKTGQPWARWVCAKPIKDTKNCGFKKWID